MDTGCLLVVVTIPDKDAAEYCETLVRERLAAGANRLGGAHSVYWWRDKLEKATESVCLFQTTRRLFPAFLARARALHPYEVPCIVAWPLEEGNDDFYAWIRTQTQPPPCPPPA